MLSRLLFPLLVFGSFRRSGSKRGSGSQHFGIAAWALAASLLCACSPGFFALEAREADEVLEASESEPAPSAWSEADLGKGCSPKGCLRDAPAGPALAGSGSSNAGAGQGSAAPPRVRARLNHPLRGKPSSEIEKLVKTDLDSLGSMSFGTATRGGLLNGVRFPEDPRWVLIDPPHTFGTRETVDYLLSALDAVYRAYPDSHPLFIGDLSAPRGGHLRPHISHQSGKDVDVGYFYTSDPKWYARATAKNLDRTRTWALIRALLERTDVNYIFIDRKIQRLLRSYAESIGEDKDWLNSIFIGSKGEPSIIRHEPGHETHFHVRFFSPIAEETARRCYSALLKHKKLLPMRYKIPHKVKKGETLIGLAKRYGITVDAIVRANKLRNKSLIVANRTYYIPRKGPAGPAPVVEVPPRRLPPPARPPTEPMASLGR